MDVADLQVALLPTLLDPDDLQGRTVVVVDILRATTTITAALANGAARVIPQPSVHSARATHERIGAESILGGERGGKKVDGFHQGNSPLEYSSDVVGGKSLILATTNGTVAMEQCRLARQILIGSFANISAIETVLASRQQVTILCAGTDRAVTNEDVIFAGALANRLKERTGTDGISTDDSANLAISLWNDYRRQQDNDGVSLVDFFYNTRGGINLQRIGYDHDIQFCATLDSFDTVGQLNVEDWEIRPLQ